MIRVGATIVVVTVLSAIAAPWIVPFDPASQELALRLARPTLEHLFGLDELGRDIFSRVLAGARISLFVGLTVVGISSAIGVSWVRLPVISEAGSTMSSAGRLTCC